MRHYYRYACTTALTALLACGGEGADTPADTAPPAVPGGPLTPAPGREVVVVDMVTDPEGNNRFVPDRFTVYSGDVVRFRLETGVHNASFPPDSNAAAGNLPPATPMLQVPGQTYDIAVTLAPGRYYFHCDPHALLGMVGWMEVAEAR